MTAASSRRPRIAITCDFETLTDRRGSPTPRYKLNEDYVKAVLAGGAEPYLLPHLRPEDAPAALEPADGLLVTGGEADVPPAMYGEAPSPLLGPVWPPRSIFERALILHALERSLPVLGVCGGMQILNVALGGSLYQDLRERPGSAEHQQSAAKQEAHHTVTLQSDSLLARLTGKAKLAVNSTHHQAVHALGRKLVATAVAEDGVIEGIELPSAAFVLGVQWHPESLRQPEQRAIYAGLVHAARERLARTA